jgi:hypothetical protein
MSLIRQIHLWLRPVLIPGWFVVVFVAIGIVAWQFLAVGQWLIAVCMFGFTSAGELEIGNNLGINVLYALLVAIVFGVYRGIYFHPATNSPYAKWLVQTPWRYPMPLPLGPLHLVPQDAAIVAVLMAVAALPPFDWRAICIVPILFFGAYSAILCLVPLQKGIRWPAIAFIAIAGCVILLIQSPFLALLAAILAVAVAHAAIRPVLAELTVADAMRHSFWAKSDARHLDLEQYWRVPPRQKSRWWDEISWSDASLPGLFAGWALFCLAFNFRDDRDFIQTLGKWYGIIVAGAAVGRLIFFGGRHWPPISLTGRFGTGRYIVPAYDYPVFALPLLCAIVGSVLPSVLIAFGAPKFVAFPTATSAVIALAFGLRPSWQTWDCTGHFRLPSTPRNPKNVLRS